jgi:DNA-binding CsgD family transcriptional regulator
MHRETTFTDFISSGGNKGWTQARKTGHSCYFFKAKGADEIMQLSTPLTARELQAAVLVWEGLTNHQIARALGTTEQVIKNYLHQIFDKLGVWSRLELAVYIAVRGGSEWPAGITTAESDLGFGLASDSLQMGSEYSGRLPKGLATLRSLTISPSPNGSREDAK